jgi:hypothetical protein
MMLICGSDRRLGVSSDVKISTTLPIVGFWSTVHSVLCVDNEADVLKGPLFVIQYLNKNCTINNHLTVTCSDLNKVILRGTKKQILRCEYKGEGEPHNRLRRTHRVSGVIAQLFLNLGTRKGCVVSITPRLPLPPGKTQYPFYRRLGGHRSRSG